MWIIRIIHNSSELSLSLSTHLLLMKPTLFHIFCFLVLILTQPQMFISDSIIHFWIFQSELFSSQCFGLTQCIWFHFLFIPSILSLQLIITLNYNNNSLSLFSRSLTILSYYDCFLFCSFIILFLCSWSLFNLFSQYFPKLCLLTPIYSLTEWLWYCFSKNYFYIINCFSASIFLDS